MIEKASSKFFLAILLTINSPLRYIVDEFLAVCFSNLKKNNNMASVSAERSLFHYDLRNINGQKKAPKSTAVLHVSFA